MKKLIKPNCKDSHIYLYEFYYHYEFGPCGNHYWVRCVLPGNECSTYLPAICIPN